MISLSEYKQHLISVHSWPIDNSKDEIEKRKKIMNDKYPDEYIEKIISDTKDFIYDVLSSETIKSGYFLKEIDDDTTSYIKLNLHGGCPSDTLFVDDTSGRIISEYLMKQVFGSYLSIYVKYDEIEDTSDEDILSYYYRYYIYMQGFPENIDEIKESFFGKSKQLLKVGNTHK
jgi:hypothetical protein